MVREGYVAYVGTLPCFGSGRAHHALFLDVRSVVLSVMDDAGGQNTEVEDLVACTAQIIMARSQAFWISDDVDYRANDVDCSPDSVESKWQVEAELFVVLHYDQRSTS